MTTLPTKPASAANWDAYGAALDTVVREVQSAVASGSSGTTIPGVLSSLVTRRRPQTFTGLDAAASDNTTAINTGLAAMQPYDTWVFPQGSFKHSNKITWPIGNVNARVEGTGKMSELVATNPDLAAFGVYAKGSTLSGIKHTVLGATARGNGQNQDTCPWFFSGSTVSGSFVNLTDITAEGLMSTGAKDAGVFVFGVSRMVARDILVDDSFADGFHITFGSTDIDVADCIMDSPGDDGLAVVSYANETTCARIKARHITVLDSDARAFSVVGADTVDYHDLRAIRSRAAGLYIATEVGSGASNNSKAVSNVDVSHVYLEDVSWAFDQGVVCLLNLLSGSLMSNVRVRGVQAGAMRQNANGDAYGTIKNSNGSGGRFTGIVLSDWKVAKGSQATNPGLYVDTTNSTVSTKGTAVNPASYFPYAQLTAQSSGTFVQGNEGTVVYNAAGGIGTSTSTVSAPDITITRVSAR